MINWRYVIDWICDKATVMMPLCYWCVRLSLTFTNRN